MNLVVDIGNSFIKLAVFENGKTLVDQVTGPNSFLRIVKELFEIYPKINNAIISSVGELKNKEVEILSLFCRVHVLSHESKIPFKNR